MRSNSIGPYLTLTPLDGILLEYWDTHGGCRVFIPSAVVGATAKELGCQWHQLHTGLNLAPAGQAGDTQTNGFKCGWAGDYVGVRQTIRQDVRSIF